MTRPQGPTSVWDALASYHLPRVVLHQHSGQQADCLAGLVEYAAKIATNKHTFAFQYPEQIIGWLWRQPVKLDLGEGPTVAGCHPAQRSRIWPDNGLNCWEAVAHLLGVAFCNSWPIEFHIYDARTGNQRHVFPAIRPLNAISDNPIPLVIQPPVRTGKSDLSLQAAQAAWYNDLLGGVHFVGDKVLRVFGMGDLSDQLADLEADELPDWARTAKQKEQRATQLLKQAAAQDKAKKSINLETKEDRKSITDLDSLRKKIDALIEENNALKARIPKG